MRLSEQDPIHKLYPALVREVFIRKKKVVNFHNFGPDPPPPESCETSIFFLLHDQKTIICKIRKILP